MNGDKDKHLLFLEGRVRIVLTEWVPVGGYFINELHRRFGCYSSRPKGERSADGAGEASTPFFITSALDQKPHGAIVSVPPDQESKVRVEDHRHLKFIRFEGKIESLETGGDHQEERIGVDISHEGHVCYAMEIKRTSDGEDRASLDLLASIAADLTYDTSQLMNSMFNGYQRRLLDVVHKNESTQRRKWLIIAAERIVDQEGNVLSEEAILENPAFAAEVRQLFGRFDHDAVSALPDGPGFALFGENGSLCVNPDSNYCLKGMLSYGLMSSMSTFLDNVFGRVAYCWDKVKGVHDTADTKDPDEMIALQAELSALTDDQAILASASRLIRGDIPHVQGHVEAARVADHARCFSMTAFDRMYKTFMVLGERLEDLDILLDSLESAIENVRTFISALTERETFGINRAMNILTVVSVIVLPLTLITGIYGMNFQAYTPGGPLTAPLNMPELRWPYAYIAVLGLMAAIALGLGTVFHRLRLLWPSKRKR